MSKISSILLNKALDGDTSFPKDLYDVTKLLSLNEDPKLNFLLKQLEPMNVEKSTEFEDFRFVHILVKFFRRYGENSGGTHFGICMSEEKRDDNSREVKEERLKGLILLGDNGIGKSSVFGALEYWATRNISEAEYRKIVNQELFYRHGINNPDIQIYTSDDKKYDLNDKGVWKSSHDVKRFFISEYSILESAAFMTENGKDGKNWYRCLCYMLGIHPYLIELAFDDDNEKIYKRIRHALEQLKEWIAESTHADEILDNIHNQIIDSSIILNESERNNLRKYQEVLSNRLIAWESSFDLANFENEIESVEPSLFQYIPAIRSFSLSCNDIKMRLRKLSRIDQQFSKNEFLETSAKGDLFEKEFLKSRLMDAVSGCLKRLTTIFEPNIQYDEIISQKNKFAFVEKLQGKIDTAQIDTLLARLQEIRKKLADSIEELVKEIFDKDFEQAVRAVFDKTFIDVQHEKFNFDIRKIDNHLVLIEVNDSPVHIYFNTFRYRLFCLTMQVMVNLKMMKQYKFNFPIIFDDVFYANDYKNKRQLYKFFEILEDKATAFLSPGDDLQILFFAHDEQLVATLHKKFYQSFRFGRMIEPNDFKDASMQTDLQCKTGDNTYFNLYFTIYKPS